MLRSPQLNARATAPQPVTSNSPPHRNQTLPTDTVRPPLLHGPAHAADHQRHTPPHSRSLPQKPQRSPTQAPSRQHRRQLSWTDEQTPGPSKRQDDPGSIAHRLPKIGSMVSRRPRRCPIPRLRESPRQTYPLLSRTRPSSAGPLADVQPLPKYGRARSTAIAASRRLPDSRNRGSLGDRYRGARDFRSRTNPVTPGPSHRAS